MAREDRAKRLWLASVVGAVVGPIFLMFFFQIITDGFEDASTYAAALVFSIYILALLTMFTPAIVRWFRMTQVAVRPTLFLLVTIVLSHVVVLGGLAISDSTWVLVAYPVAAALLWPVTGPSRRRDQSFNA